MSATVSSVTAFRAGRRLAAGAVADVTPILRAAAALDPAPILVFDDATGRAVDLDLSDAPPVPPAEPAPAKGRPRLGVVAREVTLLPRHWDWLAAQPGGASAALRRLVDEARRADGAATATRQAREAAYRVMTALAGDEPGFETAIRALFAGDRAGMAAAMIAWPADIHAYAMALAWPDQPDGPPPAA
jgi:hypothetical protein